MKEFLLGILLSCSIGAVGSLGYYSYKAVSQIKDDVIAQQEVLILILEFIDSMPENITS